MSSGLDRRLRLALEAKLNNSAWRSLVNLQSAQGATVLVDGRRLINFSSNDYLGLANNEELKAAQKKAIDKYGVGAGASHLVVGHCEVHEALEEKLAEWTGRDRALVFSSGYMANVAVLSTLCSKGDILFADRLNHASLIDGALASGAKVRRYKHCDLNHLEQLLEGKKEESEKLEFIVTDSVFSMDGDIAPLRAIRNIAEQRGAILVVDDAHGIGVLGKTGAGCVESLDLNQRDLPVLVGTFGKALGVAGAFVAGSNDLIEALIQYARNYIYTTAMPPATAATVLKSIELAQRGDHRRAKLELLAARMQKGIQQLACEYNLNGQINSHTAIQPFILGSNDKALSLSGYLLERGFLVTAIRPPTVPDNSARLRISLSAEHSEEQVGRLLQTLHDGCEHLGVAA